MFDRTFLSPRNVLSPQKELELANFYVENARKTKDLEIALALCDDAGAALSRMKRAAKKLLTIPLSVEDQALRDGFAGACFEHANLLERLGYSKMAEVSYKRAEKWGYVRPTKDPGPTVSSSTESAGCDIARVPKDIFPDDMRQPTVKCTLPDADERLKDTSQLAYCLALLQATLSLGEEFEPSAASWVKATENNTEEKERLKAMGIDLIQAFSRDELKDTGAIAEVVCLAPFLEKEYFHSLLMLFVDGVDKSSLLDVQSLKGLAQLVQNAPEGYLDSDDLATILRNLNTRLQDTHAQSLDHICRLTLAVSNVLDAMADTKVSGLERVELHEPLSAYLNELQASRDPYLAYQAAYAFQALQRVPDNESPWQATMRRTGVVLKGVSGLVSAAKGLDVKGFITELGHLQEGMGEVIQVAKIGYEGVSALVESGQGLLESLIVGLSFKKKRAWYTALRGTDTLLRDGQLAKFKILVCEAPCQRDLAFQLGVCQRLGDLAANPLWGIESRQGAVAFLGEMYRNDVVWGQQALVKQWILHILMQLASTFASTMPSVESLLQELESNGDEAKRVLYQDCRKESRSLHPLQVTIPTVASRSLLDLVQNKSDVEADLRQLRKQRLKERGEAVYIPPQAKANLQASDDNLFDLTKEVEGFLSSERKVMLLLGDSGGGKSTFNRQLECDLWDAYKKKEDRIPLFINLPAIDKPEQDLIAKQLRKTGFTEPQIRELKVYRQFILICDGYDESQQIHNLYISNGLQVGEWRAQMIISCRSEYLGLDYRDQFQPADRYHQAKPELFQEAVIAPFSKEQVQDYIDKYVSANTLLWSAADYSKALVLIPSLQDLVKNPFMLTLSLEVLPRMVDPGHNLLAAQITRVTLYDHFVEQWLERGKKRLAETSLSGGERRAFEVLVKEGFTENGIAFLKDLATAIYERQSGNPVVEYRRFVDEGTWKDVFFGRDYEKQLLLEASPFSRSGNQYRFIHKSLLEYCVARAVFEPRENGNSAGSAPALYTRRSASSVSSFENRGGYKEESSTTAHAVLESVLTRINFAGESSILHFLEERVRQDAVFEKQLIAVIERSKTDKTVRLAATNAITILNVARPAVKYELPEPDQRITSTSQLAYCLSLLPSPKLSAEELDETERAWSQAKVTDPDEQKRLRMLATDLVEAFIDEEDFQQETIVAEVAQREFKKLPVKFIDGIRHGALLEIHQLEGLAQLMQDATPGYLEADDLVDILEALSTRLQHTHHQSTEHLYLLALTVSHVLDAMADCHVKDLSHEQLHKPFSAYLNELKGSSDPYLVYQAAYAFQALLHVPNDESLVQTTPWRTIKVAQGVSGVASAAKDLDLENFIGQLAHIQEGLPTSHVVQIIIANQRVTSLVESGKSFLESIKESFKDRNPWYPALRGIDTLLQDGQLARSKKLACGAPCRRDPAFQWGVCQRLGILAGNPLWDEFTRQNAVAFLGELYEDDAQWGQHATVKQWILKILIHLEASTESPVKDRAGMLLQELERNGDATKRALFQTCLKERPASYPLAVALPQPTSSLLLNRVQNRPDVEADLQRLRKQRLEERGNAVYIPLQAKANLQASDDNLFDLKKEVEGFLSSERKVMLLLGDSGGGKSTFNRQLECDLWDAYKKKHGRIPLFINLSAIDKPEQDLITKQLRRALFSESQIRELKVYRQFILICDGYDESQQIHNLYTSNRLNQPGEWRAQMIISCRSEYLGLVYRDRFQPTDRDYSAASRVFLEAVIVPFSMSRVQDYVKQYVCINRPLWRTKDYLKAFSLIPSLQDLVKNPFMLTLSLEVLPRMVDPGQDLSGVRVTRVALYDQFLEQWLERGKKRLVEKKDLNYQEKKVFENLSDDDFAQNGVTFLRALAAAMYKEQAGNPVVEYSPFRDQGTWKEDFFSRDDEKQQLLREACPLTRSGNQYRFIHKSLLEYCLARAVFEPRDSASASRAALTQAIPRRGSVDSIMSFENQAAVEEAVAANEQAVLDSPLARRSFVDEPSILHFLAERVQQEPLFKQQLLVMIECSKTDKEARKAAANAITILVKAGVQFNRADLKGIQIPGADLSYGAFDSAQLQGADLRKVNLRNVWLRQGNLNNAQMARVQFGERPYLLEDDEVRSCAYSPDEKFCAVGLGDGTISMYDTSSWAKAYTLRGHTDSVTSVVYSPSGQQIASGSKDGTVRVWDAQTGAPGPVLSGHTSGVTSVVYSPNGQQIASGSDDGTVRLWDAQTGAPGPILSGHTSGVASVVYSPSGQQIVSGSNDGTVRLWEVNSGQCLAVVEDFHGLITSITWNATPNGTYFATGCNDKSVRMWQVIEEEDRYQVCLHWSSMHDRLIMSNASIQNVQDLSRINMRLLEQRSTVGQPILPLSFREVSKKLISMASVAYRLKAPSNRNMMDTAATADSPAVQSASRSTR